MMIRICAVLCVLACWSLPLHAQSVTWATSGVGVATSANNEYLNNYLQTYTFKNMNITDDGNGGMIMCWMGLSSYYQAYCARIDGTGKTVWSTQVAVAPTGSTWGTYYPQAVSDGAGGAYVTYYVLDYSNTTYRIPYIQHLSASGTPLWTSGGYRLIPSTGMTTFVCAVSQMDKDGAGGVVVTYHSASTTAFTYGTIYSIRVNGTGPSPNIVWGPVTVGDYPSTSSELLYMGSGKVDAVTCSDNAGGAFVAYHTYSGSNYYNHIAHINSSGQTVFNNQATTVNGYYDYGDYGFQICSDGGTGAILTYVLYYNPVDGTNYETQGIRVTSTGSVLWGPKAVGAPTYYQYNSRIAADGNGGFFLTQYDGWNTGGQMLQHINGSGTMLYNGTNGINISGGSAQSYSQVIHDGRGNAICTWSNGSVVYAQKYSGTTGATMWGSTPLNIASGTTYYPTIQDDGAGGAFIGWNALVSGTYDVLAQHVLDTAMAPHSRTTGLSINVGSVRVGTTVANSTVSVENYRGSNSTQQFGLLVSNATSLQGTATLASPTFPTTVAVGSLVPLTINVKPTKNGPFTDTLYIYTNDPLKPTLKIAVSGVGIFPHLSSSDTLNMQPTHVLATYVRDFTINNTGTDVLHLGGASISGGDVTNFGIVSGQVQDIPAAGSGLLRMSFTPTSGAVKVTTLSIVTDDSVNPKRIQVSGRGIYPHIVAPGPVAFPFTTVDLRSSTRSLLVSNTGTENLVIAANCTFGGPNASEFSITATTLPMTIAPGATGTINLKWAPLGALGPHSGTFNIVSNYDSMSPFPVQLTGTAVDGAPDMLFAQQLDFGRVHVGKFDTVTFRITNSANATKRLYIYTYTLSGPYAANYQIVGAPSVPDTIQVNSYRDLRIRFSATQAGTIPASLRMNTNAADFPIEVPLFGTGIKGSVTAEPLAFGKVALNVCKDTVLHIVNYGQDVLTISGFSLQGASALAYTVVGNANLTLQAGSSGDIHLRFCPVTAGDAPVTARIISSDGDTTLVQITGTGANAGSLQAAASLDFGLIAIQQTLTKKLHVTNTGEIPVTITDVHFTGAITPMPYSTDLVVPTTIPPGASIDVNIAFSSSTGGQMDANIVFVSDGGTTSVALKGWASPDPFAAEPRQLFDTTIVAGTSANAMMHVANFTTGARRILSLQITGPGANAYNVVYPLSWPMAVNGQGNDSIVLAFHPSSVGVYMATLEITLDPATAGGNNELIRVALTGAGKTPTDVRSGDALPQTSALWQNYPNPFAGTTSISYNVPDRSPVTLKVYDVMGRLVRELVNGTRDAGTYDVTLSGDGLSAGLYTYELAVNGVTTSRLMQVVK